MRTHRETSAVWTAFKRFLLIVLSLVLLAYLGYHGWTYLQVRAQLPQGVTMAGLDVSGMALEEAGEYINERYGQPVILMHGEDALELNPADVAFTVDVAGMLAEAEQYRTQQEWWKGYLFQLFGWSWEPLDIPLRATHDQSRVRYMVEVVAGFLDKPAQGPQILAQTSFAMGRDGFVTDIEASLSMVEEALYRPENRVARLVIEEQEAPSLSFDLLEDVIRGQLQSFEGMGIVFVKDLQTGEEILINADMAISGTSVLKIAIFMEAYRALDNPPSEEVQTLFYETAALSSNFGANLLLHVVAGEDNTYRGADILTESMRRLGLNNTFIAVPYDASPPPYRQTTYVTPANSRPDVTEDIDPTMQTTAEEIGTLLTMIYDCSKGGGALLAVYPDELTPQECQAIIDLMVLNEEGNLIRFGVPAGVPVSHKHGWARGTHADAGIVLSPGGDYVLVEYLHLPGDWLQPDISFPILREISRAVYNYFNFEEPYLGDALLEAERFDPDDPFFQNLPDAEAPATEEGAEGEETPAATEPAETGDTSTLDGTTTPAETPTVTP